MKAWRKEWTQDIAEIEAAETESLASCGNYTSHNPI